MPNINKNIIMQAGAAVANATNKAAGLSASTPEPGSIISVIQLVNGGCTIGPDALAHFTESVRNKLLSLLVHMEPIQDFNGYDHPWPAGGGKNLDPYNNLNNSSRLWGSTNSNQKSAFQSLPTGTYTMSCKFKVLTNPNSEANVQYGVFVRYSDGGGEYVNIIPYQLTTAPATVGAVYEWHKSFTLTESLAEQSTLSVYFYCASGGTSAIIANAYDIQIEKGNIANPTFAPYENICPISGRTGANAYVSPTPNVADAITYAADWTTPAGTVYAGSADIVTGDIKAAPYYASYNGETLVGPWVSSMDVYDPDGTPSTGAQVVDLGGSMTEYHITGQEIITLVGDNYIWSDSGDVTIIE